MQIEYQNGTIGYLDIIFGPKWDYVPLTKNYVENFLHINLVNKINIGKIAMCASELLENAVKYSNRDGIRIMIKKIIEKNSIILTVMNYTDQKSADYLKYIVDSMNNADPMEYYINRMKEASLMKNGESGLGLARINYEAGARIKTDYDIKNMILSVNADFLLS